ncbi:SPOR domain-containing protein [Pseudorhodoferax sp. Leaf274]|uniref:SPOR domain-containing protein n=1 Tax=Pseudorhodoferax sp. Leaf274 TaxID=1736318 RepID=UPI0007031BB1|nr:SPOR domain-containing protein [Pseudorhodoferax sp. Leaf274]KQP43409.1 hypothetical protein ASF44_07585 [Pseudorhodoferax sp. Leaf274]
MAFFKFRARGPKGDEQPASPAETIDDMRRRARHRLIGATVLVLVGVLGFPLLFDSQPRPIQVDIPIEIPDRDKAAMPGAGAGGKVAQAAPGAAPGTVSADASLNAREEVVPAAPPARAETKAEPRAEHKVEPRAETKAETKAEPKSEARHEPKAEPKAEAKATTPAPTPAPAADSGARARALLEGKAAAPAAAPASASAEQAGRFVVQVGAFADADKARETRQRLERAGLKTYTQEVQTKDGARIRVRVGPYGVRAEADKAAERIKSLSLPASVLTL